MTSRIIARAAVLRGIFPCFMQTPRTSSGEKAFASFIFSFHSNAVRASDANTISTQNEESAKGQEAEGSGPVLKLLQFCVVGSGPAGFYTADRLLKTFQHSAVDIIERLPTPFGLIRSGVAPDHPETKAVINQFSKIATDERASFFGNVTLGKDVSIGELQNLYDGVVLAYGAESCRTLGAPGEDLPNVLSAREFVWWYNGHPDYVNLPVDLESTETAVILGQGNVALDCARILLRNKDDLAKTDIAEHALEALKKSNVRKVLVVGRRGPVQAACTAKEVREILGGGVAVGLKDIKMTIHEKDLQTTERDQEEMKASRTHRRVFDLLQKASSKPPPAGATKELEWVFFRSPVSFYASTDDQGHQRVGGVRFEKTRLEGGGGGMSQRAVGTEEYEDMPAGMNLDPLLRALERPLFGVERELDRRLVLRSIGYKSLPVPGLPFDYRKGVVPHQFGRVLSQESTSGSEAPGAEVPGLYVVGWLKRGPTGIIGTNLIDAEETSGLQHGVSRFRKKWGRFRTGFEKSCPGKVASIAEDQRRGVFTQTAAARQGGEGLKLLLRDKKVTYVPFQGWMNIDAIEVERGAAKGKPREKMVDLEEMVEVARSSCE